MVEILFYFKRAGSLIWQSNKHKFSFIGSLTLRELSRFGNVFCMTDVWSPYRITHLSRAMTSTVSVLSVWGFRMYARRFMGFLNAHFAKISISKPSTLSLRCLKRSHPHFPVVPRRPPRPLVSSRPGVWMLSSRLWRVSRQASPFLSRGCERAAQSHWLGSQSH